MKDGASEDEAVPYGVRKGHDAVKFEEDDAADVDSATQRQLVQTGVILLLRRTEGQESRQ